MVKMKKLIVLTAVLIIWASAHAAQPAVSGDAAYIQNLNRQMHEFVNVEREKRGLKPLQRNRPLLLIALAHSRDMAKRNYLSHVTPEGLDPTARAKKAGFNVEKKMDKSTTRVGVGENLFQGRKAVKENGVTKGYLEKHSVYAKEIVDGWMKSPSHRKNILDKTYTTADYGTVISKDGTVTVTQLFF